jgi:Domain of unknown function DUF11/SdrD B-like domain
MFCQGKTRIVKHHCSGFRCFALCAKIAKTARMVRQHIWLFCDGRTSVGGQMHYFKLVMLSMLLCLSAHLSAEAICAEVKIEIPQRASLERQAFIARLGIENGIDLPISELNVQLQFKGADGSDVVGTSDPNNVGAAFFYRIDRESNVTGGYSGAGAVAGNTNGELIWLIIPAAGTGGTTAAGKNYAIGATISFRQGGELRTLSVSPDTITVEPQPKLTLDYFLPRDVYGDDPFTPLAETPEPFTLGVRIKNTGAGAARKMKIESAQPRIVENTSGLLIAFNIISAFVQGEPAQPNLLINFGDIASGQAKLGRWQMTVSLTGQFTEFGADFTHEDSLGGALTSLVTGVTTHTLIKDVLVDKPGRDAVLDYLALDLDTYRTYESDNIDTVVVDRSDSAVLTQLPTGDFQVVLGNSILASYGRVRDPTNGQFRIERATRLGGALLSTHNVWTSKTRPENSTTFIHYINVYDPAGASTYVITRSREDSALIAGDVFRDLNDNGIKDPNEGMINQAPMRLVGQTVNGDQVNRSIATNVSGAFAFEDLLAGTYQIEVMAMPGLRDGIATLGTAAGTAVPGRVSNIVLTAGQQASAYRFAKIATSAKPQSELGVSFESLSPGIGIGQSLSVTVIARNNGPDTSTTANVQLALQNGLTLVSANAIAGSFANGIWTLPTIIPGNSVSLNLQIRADLEGSRTVQAQLTGALPDPELGNNRATLAISASTIPGELIFRDGFESITAAPKSSTEALPFGSSSNNSANNDGVQTLPNLFEPAPPDAVHDPSIQDQFEQSRGFEDASEPKL